MTGLSPGARWEYVNRTMGTVTAYTIEPGGHVVGEHASPVRLRNEDHDGGIAEIWAVSLIRPLSDQGSHWRPA